MNHYRISIDIEAESREHASERLLLLSDILSMSGHRWIIEVLPDGIEERLPLAKTP